MGTWFVLVFYDPESSIDSGCRDNILSEVKAHGCEIQQFGSDIVQPKVATSPDYYDGMHEVEYADPEGRCC